MYFHKKKYSKLFVLSLILIYPTIVALSQIGLALINIAIVHGNCINSTEDKTELEFSNFFFLNI